MPLTEESESEKTGSAAKRGYGGSQGDLIEVG